MAGSRAVSDREPGQVRKEAALSEAVHAPRTSLAGAEKRRARPGTFHGDGCTVHIFRRMAEPERQPSSFAAGAQVLLAIVAVMWGLEIVDVALDHRLDNYGIEPRDVDALPGIVSSPFLHAGFGHLIGNTIPLVVMGLAIALAGAMRVTSVTVIVGLIAGLGTWLTAARQHRDDRRQRPGLRLRDVPDGALLLQPPAAGPGAGDRGAGGVGRVAAGQPGAHARGVVAGPPVRRDRWGGCRAGGRSATRLAWRGRCSRSTAATAPGPSSRSWARTAWCARCATRSSSARSTTPTCSWARAAPARPSMAKLLACALNADGGPRTDFSPDDPACKAIMNGTSLDVVEMDAASNNSVDDIRELRENVSLSPMGGSRRVYILDEAHMLSTAAWNAFLKTLEEPPAHVVFVLATTEAHKVPATIIDRCHRFDFGRPSLEQIAARAAAGVRGGGHHDPRSGGGHDRPQGHRQLPRRARHAGAAGDLRRHRHRAGRRAREPGRRRRHADPGRHRRAGGQRAEARAAGRADAGRVRSRLRPVHARHGRSPAPPAGGADPGRGARLVRGHRRALRPPGRPGRGAGPGRAAARRGPAGRRPGGGQGRLGAAAAAGGGAAEGHPAPGRPDRAGADAADRPAGANAGRCTRARPGARARTCRPARARRARATLAPPSSARCAPPP